MSNFGPIWTQKKEFCTPQFDLVELMPGRFSWPERKGFWTPINQKLLIFTATLVETLARKSVFPKLQMTYFLLEALFSCKSNNQTWVLFLAPEVSLTGYWKALEPSPKFYFLSTNKQTRLQLAVLNKQTMSKFWLLWSPSWCGRSWILEPSIESISCPVSQ